MQIFQREESYLNLNKNISLTDFFTNLIYLMRICLDQTFSSTDAPGEAGGLAYENTENRD